MLLRNNTLAMMLILASALGFMGTISACITTFINDTDPRIIIFDRKEGTYIPVKKNERRRFGNAHQHADFDIAIQEPHKRIFVAEYTCEQHSCSKNGNIILKLSDIKNNTNDAELFTITQYEPHSSMTQQVIDNVKKCSGCN